MKKLNIRPIVLFVLLTAILFQGYSQISVTKIDENSVTTSSDGFIYSLPQTVFKIDIVYEKVPEDIKSFSDSKDTSELKTSKNIRLEQTFDLFEVPFLVGYKIGNRKFTLNLSGGFSPAYVVSNSSTLIADEQKHDIGSSTNINSVIVNSSFSLGIQYAFTKKLALNFEPTFKYSLNPFSDFKSASDTSTNTALPFASV